MCFIYTATFDANALNLIKGTSLNIIVLVHLNENEWQNQLKSRLCVATCSTFLIIVKCHFWKLWILIPVSLVCHHVLSSSVLLWLDTVSCAFSEQESFLFLVYFVVTLFHFHEKKQKVWVSDTLIEMSDGMLHFWGGANIVGPIFVIVHLLAPVSLNGSSPCGGTVRLVWAKTGDTASVFFNHRRWKKWVKRGRLRYWRMCC